MKTAHELAADSLDGPDVHKRRAQALRRLAGGIRRETERKAYTGLTDKEVRALQDATSVLEKLAATFVKAQTVTQDRRNARDAAKQAVLAAMKDNFGSLTSVADKVALIAAVQSYFLRHGHVVTLDDLRSAFDDSIDSLAFRLSEQAATRQVREVVDEAWAKFVAARADLKNEHASVVVRLQAAADGT